MPEQIEYIGILLLAILAGGVATLIMMANRFLGPKRPNPVKA